MSESSETQTGYPSTLELWKELDTTDPRYAKKSDYGAKLTSINGIYQVKKMTEQFGPCGVDWGFEITQSQLDETVPLFARQWNQHDRKPEYVLNDNNQPTRVGTGMLHTMHIKLWFVAAHNGIDAPLGLPENSDMVFATVPEGIEEIGPGDIKHFHSPGRKRYEIEGIGHTPYIYMNANDTFVQADMDYEKKSLTDAITNAMAKLGMSADVRMGMYDIPDYVQERRDEVAIEIADDADAEVAQQRHEFEDWFTTHIKTLSESVTIRELELLYKGARPRVERQGTPEQKTLHMDTKNMRFRDLAPPKEETTSD